ncbi:MAG: PQQ-dependent sugar dehydrogenase [Deltaproteobacteria bacterium]|nr:PQQ-dependent sugar dehydrogenase [Deltaproteobacteria bacterium]
MKSPAVGIIAITTVAVALAACGDDAGNGATDTLAADTAVADTVVADTAVADTAADTLVADTESDGAGDTLIADTEVPDGGGGEGTCDFPAAAALAHADVPAGYCAATWASGLDDPRGMIVAPSGEVLVVERGKAQVTALWDDDGDGVSGATERAKLAGASGLNHGIALRDGFLYASSATTVFRWAWTSGARADLGAATVVVKSIPSGGHSTRSLRVDDAGRLYVSVGSAGNVDADSSRARIRRFDLASLPSGGFDFASGEVFADGLRNEVGLAWDADGVLWGVQNGVDNLNRGDLGGDIHDDNPGELLSRFATAGAHHGYPWCWAEYQLPAGVGMGRGTMWAHPSSMNDGTHDDAWCRDTTNVQPPALSMQAHSAPLGLVFYDGDAFPAAVKGDVFVAFHGSWNRSPATGYKVVRVHFEGGVAQDPVPFLEYDGAGDIGADWPHRPVDVAVAADGRLLVTSDASNRVMVVGYDPAR